MTRLHVQRQLRSGRERGKQLDWNARRDIQCLRRNGRCIIEARSGPLSHERLVMANADNWRTALAQAKSFGDIGV